MNLIFFLVCFAEKETSLLLNAPLCSAASCYLCLFDVNQLVYSGGFKSFLSENICLLLETRLITAVRLNQRVTLIAELICRVRCQLSVGEATPFTLHTDHLNRSSHVNISVAFRNRYFFHRSLFFFCFFCPFVCFAGVHRDLYSWDGAEADCSGSVLLFPTGLEYLWRRHCLPQSDGVGSLKCRRAVCPAIFQIGKINL